MARTPQNPDRNFSADGDVEESLEGLRASLAFSKPGLPFNEAAQVRIGKVIGDAVLPSRLRRPLRRLAGKRNSPP